MADSRSRPRFGLLTSGGDSPGMNGAIEALVRLSAATEWEPWGIWDGFDGLSHGKLRRLSEAEVTGTGGLAGTFLGSSRPRDLDRPEGLDAMAEAFRSSDLDALVILGGDGSIGYIGTRLQARGVPCLGIPCTIDNDVPATVYTLGFDSACQFAMTVIDGMRQTGRSLPDRLFLIETLGGKTGHLALAIARAAQADGVAIPEVRPDWAHLGGRLTQAVKQNGHALLVIAEGVAWEADIESALAPYLSHRIRRTSLGHAQRGGVPSFTDRTMAVRFAEAALAALVGGRSGHMVGWDGSGIVEVPLASLAGGKREPDLLLCRSINGLA